MYGKKQRHQLLRGLTPNSSASSLDISPLLPPASDIRSSVCGSSECAVLLPFMPLPLSGMIFLAHFSHLPFSKAQIHLPGLGGIPWCLSPFFPACTLIILSLFPSPCLVAVICLSSCLPYSTVSSFVIRVIFYFGILVCSGRSISACWIDWMPILQVS